MTKNQTAWIAKSKAGLPGMPSKAAQIDTSPRRIFVIERNALKQWDYPGSVGFLTKTIDQGVEFAEKQLASLGSAGTYYVMEIKKVVKSEAIITTKVEDLEAEPNPEKMPEHFVLNTGQPPAVGHSLGTSPGGDLSTSQDSPSDPLESLGLDQP